VQIVRLRQKLRAAGSDAEITNVRGRGWSLS
jgi:DNA-binding response OmpR family regulator